MGLKMLVLELFVTHTQIIELHFIKKLMLMMIFIESEI